MCVRKDTQVKRRMVWIVACEYQYSSFSNIIFLTVLDLLWEAYNSENANIYRRFLKLRGNTYAPYVCKIGKILQTYAALEYNTEIPKI